MATEKSAALPNGRRRPSHWDKRVSAAYLRMLGASQEKAASAVGRSERTVRQWESEDTWPFARQEARERWLSDLTDKARLRLIESLDDPSNGDLALKILERMDDDLAPAKHKLEHSGEGGGPVEVAITHRVIDPGADRD